MKSYSLILIAAMAMIGCTEKNNSGLSLVHRSIDKYYNIDIEDSLKSPMFDNEGYSLHNSATVVWPTSIDGEVPAELQKAILQAAFGDSVSTTLDAAFEQFVKTGYGLEKNEIKSTSDADSATANTGEFMQSVAVEMCEVSDKKYVFSIFTQTNAAGAAHGMYTQQFITYDRKDKKIVTLDLLFTDKEKLRELLESKRINDLKEQNMSYDDYMIEEFPISESFRIYPSQIEFTYQPYDIASYAEGIQTVTLFYYDMDQAGILTPYAKKIME